MRLPPYSEYKPSGIEWLGEVPEHWEVKRGRFCIGVNPPSDGLRRLHPEDEVSFVPMEAVGEYGGLSLDHTRAISEIGSGYTEFDDGDVVVAKITPCFENGKGALATGLVNGIAFGTTELHVLRAAPNLEQHFLFYFTISRLFRGNGEGEMYGAGGQKRVPPEFCKNIRVPLPAVDEQRTIADFLDRETAKINMLVAKKRTLIERLQEKRTALISRTVTRSLPPNDARAAGLDPHPKLKPTGIDWLGEVPEHWDVKRLKMAAHLTDRTVEADEELPVPYVGMEDIESWTGRLLPINPNVVPTGTANEFKAGNTLFGKLRPYLAKACNPDFDGLCSTELLVLQGSDIDRRVLLYSLLSDGFIKLVDSATYGSKMPRASWDFVGNCVLPIAPSNEQRAIADFLDRETVKIDVLVAKIETAIERLKEYRTALITAAVTGKIDVREAAA